MTTFTDLHQANIARDIEWQGNATPFSAAHRGNELAGETGEAIESILDTLGYTAALAAAGGRLSNLIKKLERERLGWSGSRANLDQVKAELGDVVICAYLCAMNYGFDLTPEVAAKFNATSEKMGLATRLAVPASFDVIDTPAFMTAEQFDALFPGVPKFSEAQKAAASDYVDGRFYAHEDRPASVAPWLRD